MLQIIVRYLPHLRTRMVIKTSVNVAESDDELLLGVVDDQPILQLPD